MAAPNLLQMCGKPLLFLFVRFCCLSMFMGPATYTEATGSEFPGILYINVHIRLAFRFLPLACVLQFDRRSVSAFMANTFARVSSTVSPAPCVGFYG